MRKPAEIPRDVFFGDTPAATPAPTTPAPAASPPPPTTTPAPAAPAAPVPVTDEGDEAKLQVTIYLSESMAKKLEAVRYHLLTDHNVKVSKSAIAEYALSQIPADLTPLAHHFAVGER